MPSKLFSTDSCVRSGRPRIDQPRRLAIRPRREAAVAPHGNGGRLRQDGPTDRAGNDVDPVVRLLHDVNA